MNNEYLTACKYYYDLKKYGLAEHIFPSEVCTSIYLFHIDSRKVAPKVTASKSIAKYGSSIKPHRFYQLDRALKPREISTDDMKDILKRKGVTE